MTPDQQFWLSAIQAFGFPICIAIAFWLALCKIGNRLLDSHIGFVNDVKADVQSLHVEVRERTEVLTKFPADPMTICHAKR